MGVKVNLHCLQSGPFYILNLCRYDSVTTWPILALAAKVWCWCLFPLLYCFVVKSFLDCELCSSYIWGCLLLNPYFCKSRSPYHVFTYIYSLLIEKGICDRKNVSSLCVFHLEISSFFCKSFPFLFIYIYIYIYIYSIPLGPFRQ